MKKIKSVLTLGCFLLLSGCTLPYQKEEYPAWKTNGLIDGTNTNGTISHAYQGLEVGDTATTQDLEITINEVSEINLTDKQDKKEINVYFTLKNTSDKKKTISYKDFPLLWNLESNDSHYIYALTNVDKKNYLNGNVVLTKNEEKQFLLSYEVEENLNKPYAIYYGEIYDDATDGNSYYFYIR